MLITLLRVTLNGPEEKRPLVVYFAAGDREHVIDVSGGELQSFARFQAVVLERCGVLVRFYAETGREAKNRWLNAVQHALTAGREAAA